MVNKCCNYISQYCHLQLNIFLTSTQAYKYWLCGSFLKLPQTLIYSLVDNSFGSNCAVARDVSDVSANTAITMKIASAMFSETFEHF